MVKCCVEGCRSNSKFSSPDITYHRLPDARCFPNLYKKWLHKITGTPEDAMVDFIAQHTSRVCSLHFTEDDFVVKTDRNRTRRTLRVEALPKQRLPLFCRALKAQMADPFAVKFQGFDNGSLRISSPMCNNNNNDPSSPSKCMVLDDVSPRNNGNALTIRKITKRIKIEPRAFQPRNKQLQGRYHPEECEISPHDPSFQTPERDLHEDPETHIPACYRGKKNVYSPYAFSITELESELGFDCFMINDNKFLKCDPAEGDYQIWRCIIRNCGARVATASAHWSILTGLRGVHYHLPTKGVAVDPGDWAPGPPSTPWAVDAEGDNGISGTSWSPDVGRDSGCEQSPVAGDMSPWARQQCNQGNSPPQLQSDSRFGVRHLLAPSVSQFQLPSAQQPPSLPYPVFSSLDALSKFCGGQVIEGIPFNGLRSKGDDRRADKQNVIPVIYPRMEVLEVPADSHSAVVDSRSMSTDEQTEYILPSPASEQNNGVAADEASQGSSSERLSSRMEESSYYDLVEVVDVQGIIQKDPLSLEDNSHHKSDNNQPPMNRRVSLTEEDAAFFQTLGPHLNLLSAPDRGIFRKKVMDIISLMCEKATASRYKDSTNM